MEKQKFLLLKMCARKEIKNIIESLLNTLQ